MPYGADIPDPAPDADDAAWCLRCGWRADGVGARDEGEAHVQACGKANGGAEVRVRFGWAVRADVTNPLPQRRRAEPGRLRGRAA